MSDRSTMAFVYSVFLLFFLGLLAYGFWIEQYLVSALAAGVMIYVAKELSGALRFIDKQKKILVEIDDDLEELEKISRSIEEDAYPHVPFFYIQRMDYALYQHKLNQKVDNRLTKEMLRRLKKLSRHVDKMNEIVTYLRENINNKYLVDSGYSPEQLIQEIDQLEMVRKGIHYNDPLAIGVTEHMIKLHKSAILRHRYNHLLACSKELRALTAEVREELVKLRPELTKELPPPQNPL